MGPKVISRIASSSNIRGKVMSRSATESATLHPSTSPASPTSSEDELAGVLKEREQLFQKIKKRRDAIGKQQQIWQALEKERRQKTLHSLSSQQDHLKEANKAWRVLECTKVRADREEEILKKLDRRTMELKGTYGAEPTCGRAQDDGATGKLENLSTATAPKSYVGVGMEMFLYKSAKPRNIRSTTKMVPASGRSLKGSPPGTLPPAAQMVAAATSSNLLSKRKHSPADGDEASSSRKKRVSCDNRGISPMKQPPGSDNQDRTHVLFTGDQSVGMHQRRLRSHGAARIGGLEDEVHLLPKAESKSVQKRKYQNDQYHTAENAGKRQRIASDERVALDKTPSHNIGTPSKVMRGSTGRGPHDSNPSSQHEKSNKHHRPSYGAGSILADGPHHNIENSSTSTIASNGKRKRDNSEVAANEVGAKRMRNINAEEIKAGQSSVDERSSSPAPEEGQGQGRSLDPKSPPQFVVCESTKFKGLVNHDWACYANVVIQLFVTALEGQDLDIPLGKLQEMPTFGFRKDEPDHDVGAIKQAIETAVKNGEAGDHDVRKHLRSLLQRLSETTEGCEDPFVLQQVLAYGTRSNEESRAKFDGRAPEDAHQYFHAVLSALANDRLRSRFAMSTVVDSKCSNTTCDGTQSKAKPANHSYHTMKVPNSGLGKLGDMFKKSLKVEGEGRCKRGTHSKSITIETMPESLVLNIDRARWVNGMPSKVQTPIDLTFDTIKLGGKMYTLQAVVQHDGVMTDEGHYTILRKHHGHWHEIDDEQCSEARDRVVDTKDKQSAMLLLQAVAM